MAARRGGSSRPFGSTRPARETFDRLAPAYDRRWARYTAATTRATLARLALRPGERLLDLGCGTGALLRELAVRGAPQRLCGVDLSPAMVAVARARLPAAIRLAVADGAALPFPSGSFDVVVSNSSFHFWPRPLRVLGELTGSRARSAGSRAVLPGARGARSPSLFDPLQWLRTNRGPGLGKDWAERKRRNHAAGARASNGSSWRRSNAAGGSCMGSRAAAG
ncbi:MAG TPA: class I SAM-dependent methyltransferase [Thermoanaerobaculia bacterium]|nr:class I SAM-dependent methyltransferase [Thermoanaerobaculia bacterium]